TDAARTGDSRAGDHRHAGSERGAATVGERRPVCPADDTRESRTGAAGQTSLRNETVSQQLLRRNQPMIRISTVAIPATRLACVLAPSASADPPSKPVARTDLYGDPLREGAIARLGTVRLRHGGGPVVFSSDGKQLISVNSGLVAQTWDVATGRELDRR